MLKKGILIFLMFFLCIGTSFAQEPTLSYEEFLELYFGITTHEMQIPEQKPLLLYTNLKPSNPLYQLLQTAVANQKFANIKTDLPLKRPALESASDNREQTHTRSFKKRASKADSYTKSRKRRDEVEEYRKH